MKNRVAWGLAVALAVLLLLGGGRLVTHSWKRLPPGVARVMRLPRRTWSFHRLTISHGSTTYSAGSTTVSYGPVEEWQGFGFFAVRVK
jgi:hypothetical protein